ncbi:MAG: TatD family hydrolase [Caldimicrobium sp.]
MMRLIDTHAHLNWPDYKKELPQVIERAKEVGIIKIIVVGIDRKTGERALEIKETYGELIEVALGFHPHEVKKIKEEDYIWLKERAREACAIGEIGLDWVKEYSPKELQIKHFERLLELSKELQKPAILHLRGDMNFWEFALDLLKNYRDYPILFHCFTANKEVAFKILEFNSLISLPGVITFEKANELREAIKYIPLKRILLETDCPFLSPEPMRGKRNEPAFIIYTAKKLAEIKGVPLQEIAEITTKNAMNFFNLEKTIN